MSDTYTPTTEQVCEAYVYVYGAHRTEGREAEFHRWLAFRDDAFAERTSQNIRALRSSNVIDMRSAGFNAGLDFAALRAAGSNVSRIHPAPSIPNPLTSNPWEGMTLEEITGGIAGASARIDAAEHTRRSLLRELERRSAEPTGEENP